MRSALLLLSALSLVALIGPISVLSCEPCRPGTFSNSTICQGCSPGSCPSQDLCSYCPAGTFSRFNFTSCIECCPGSTSFEGAFLCAPCRPGSGNSWGSASCEICPPGTYAAHSSCNAGALCPSYAVSPVSRLGVHSGIYGLQGNDNDDIPLSCCPCPPGTYGDSGGLQICRPCGAGYYSDVTGARDKGVCVKCPNGHYCPHDKTVSPIVCPQDYACKDGASKALPCSSLQSADEGSSDCNMNEKFVIFLVVGLITAAIATVGIVLAYKKYYRKTQSEAASESGPNPVYQGL